MAAGVRPKRRELEIRDKQYHAKLKAVATDLSWSTWNRKAMNTHHEEY